MLKRASNILRWGARDCSRPSKNPKAAEKRRTPIGDSQLIREGAAEVLRKPFRMNELWYAVNKALEH